MRCRISLTNSSAEAMRSRCLRAPIHALALRLKSCVRCHPIERRKTGVGLMRRSWPSNESSGRAWMNSTSFTRTLGSTVSPWRSSVPFRRSRPYTMGSICRSMFRCSNNFETSRLCQPRRHSGGHDETDEGADKKYDKQHIGKRKGTGSLFSARPLKDQSRAWCYGTSFGLNERAALVTVAHNTKEWIATHVLER